jgi:hypothetical protein
VIGSNGTEINIGIDNEAKQSKGSADDDDDIVLDHLANLFLINQLLQHGVGFEGNQGNGEEDQEDNRKQDMSHKESNNQEIKYMLIKMLSTDRSLTVHSVIIKNSDSIRNTK